jgi:hypothetical protein
MSQKFSTRRPQLPPETLQAKAAHVTLGACLLAAGLFLAWSAWDEFSCTAGRSTSTGPCGIGIQAAGAIFFVAVLMTIAGAIVLWRGVRRPVDPDGSSGWRVGQGLAVIACGVVLALMIPTLSCPPDMHLSVVFRFCVSADRSYPAPATGLVWKWVAFGGGVALGVVLLAWRRMPWALATAIVSVAFLGTAGYVAWRTTGLPWQTYSYTIGLAAAGATGR